MMMFVCSMTMFVYTMMFVYTNICLSSDRLDKNDQMTVACK